jgi:hypothetical protein
LGVTTDAALAALATLGRLVVINVVGTRVVPIDLIEFYRNEFPMLGASSGALGVVESRRRLAELAPYFESGAFPHSGSVKVMSSTTDEIPTPQWHTRVHSVSPIARNEVDDKPELAGHLLPQRGEMPSLEANTLSPGLGVLTSAASQPPVPEPG